MPGNPIFHNQQGMSGKLITNGLVLHLDGTDTTTMTRVSTRVDEWRDKQGSGNKIATGFAGSGFNPVTNSSLFGSQGGVRFTSGAFLETAAAFTTMSWATGWTILVAGQRKSLNTFFAGSDGGSYALFGGAIGARIGVGTAWNARVGFPNSVSMVFGARWGSSTIHAIHDGLLYRSVNGVPSTGSSTFGKLQFGGLQPGGAMDMDVAGALIYNRTLTDTEVRAASAWLKNRYAFGAIPEKTWNIVVDGNSLAYGNTSLGSNWTMHTGIVAATGTPTAFDYANVAVSGRDTDTCTSNAVANVDSLYDTRITAKRRICIIWEITNQLRGIGVSDTTCYNSIKAYCQARKAAGWKVIVATCLPRGESGINANFEANRLLINTAIRNNAVSEGWADAVADIGGDATIGAVANVTNTTWYNADKIHLNSTGHGLAAPYITSAINAVIA